MTRARFFPSCVADRFFADAARDAVRLLRSLGVEVEVVRDVACCGQPAWNAGHEAEARRVATYGAERLAGDDAERRGADGAERRAGDGVPVVMASGSCAAMLRHGWAELGVAAPPAVYELSEFIVDVLGVDAVGDGLRGLRVAYHHGCHALRELGVRAQPLALLQAAGAEIVEWPAAEECCGFGGLFAVKLPWVSAAMADRKLDTLPPFDVLTSADGGCLLQLRGRWGMRHEVGAGEAAAVPSGAAPGSDAPSGAGAAARTAGSASFPAPRFVHLATLLMEARRQSTGRDASPDAPFRTPDTVRGGAPR